jgi:hypothetical protein
MNFYIRKKQLLYIFQVILDLGKKYSKFWMMNNYNKYHHIQNIHSLFRNIFLDIHLNTEE